MTLQQIFIGRKNRVEMIGLFLATLELVKLRRVRVRQERIAGEITLELRPEDEWVEDDTPPTDWRNPETGEVEYDWPSEKAKQAAERRARLRASRVALMRDRKAGEDRNLEDEEDAFDYDFDDNQNDEQARDDDTRRSDESGSKPDLPPGN